MIVKKRKESDISLEMVKYLNALIKDIKKNENFKNSLIIEQEIHMDEIPIKGRIELVPSGIVTTTITFSQDRVR